MTMTSPKMIAKRVDLRAIRGTIHDGNEAKTLIVDIFKDVAMDFFLPYGCFRAVLKDRKKKM